MGKTRCVKSRDKGLMAILFFIVLKITIHIAQYI